MSIEIVESPRPEDDLHDYQREPATDFTECDACKTKPGSPALCYGCLQNRQLIGRLKQSGKSNG